MRYLPTTHKLLIGFSEGDHASFVHERVGDERTAGISLRHLSKKRKSKLVVDNLTTDFYQGEITALLGHNGAGKTTTM